MWILNLFLFAMLASPQSELGKWWKNSEIVKKLDLTQSQVAQIEQSFLDHLRRLADANAKLKQQEAQLSMLLQSDQVNASKVRSQIEHVANARAALEKTNGFMMLSIRMALSKDQWRKLQEIQTVPIPAADARIPAADARIPGADARIPGAEPLPDGVYAVGGDVQAPKVIRRRMPSYTQAARDAKAQGIVLLEAIVRKDGSIDSFKVLRGLGYGLDESAMNTIMKDWKFQPGTLNGKPVDVKIVMETSFRLY